MTRVPDFALPREGSAVATTVSIPAPAAPAVLHGAPPAAARPGTSRALWWVPLLVGVAAAGFALFQYSGQRIGFWPATAEPVSPNALSELGGGGAGEPAPVVIEPDPIPAAPRPAAPRVDPKSPAPSRPPSSPKPKPSPPGSATPAPELPQLPGSTPLPGITPLPGTAGAPGVPPGTAPPATSPIPGVPAIPGLPLPFPLPTQGACQRCLDTIEAGGNASVVNAMAHDLLCDDQAVRLRCETRVRELAPDVAEKAARGGDCASALATEAAAVQLGVDPERFRTVNGLCMR